MNSMNEEQLHEYLSQKENKYIDHILGLIYGNALGDAYGLGMNLSLSSKCSTEFWNKEAVKQRYPDVRELIPFPDYVTNRHNSRWDKGDWTDDTDQLIVLMNMLIENGGVVNLPDAAKKLKHWIENGFPEVGDLHGMGIGQTVMGVTMHSKFTSNPLESSREIWIQMGKRMGFKMAANGAVMRTSILGCASFDQPEQVEKNSILCAQLTHWDPKCVISCTTITSIQSAIIRHFKENNTSGGVSQEQIEQWIKDAEQQAKSVIDRLLVDKGYKGEFSEKEAKEQFEEYQQYLWSKPDLSDLKLDDETTIGYTYKCMGSAIWGVRSPHDFRKTIDLLIREGGDADTNAAVCGALIGCVIGYTKLPSDMLKALPNKAWLDQIVIKFLNNVILNPKPNQNVTTTTTGQADDEDTNKSNNNNNNNNSFLLKV
ncbi:hypothetical protein PPL_03392 [Heterostelium album PN500]|uniref:ADP-ribosylglycohydrolase n=1 Tax=Heterostelium pallidum (strain ATCC 26659 / Pp 5 / PN500) TaxID=670386 RepID=D3B4R6_HETP5|nr:hypothetical protein PPL_03392 [Heterostelium album PN500]EFA84314.1 hypothetical protein PPL_03392 [Heterostelium album PN500]|eukprot:XP_020436429.1 hypothetical protein PPL_03392 [Heterostelium album PN500]